MSVKNFHIHARKVERMLGTNWLEFYIRQKSVTKLNGASELLYQGIQGGSRSSSSSMELLLQESQRSSALWRSSLKAMWLPLKHELSLAATARSRPRPLLRIR